MEGFSDVGVELAERILSAIPLTEVCIVHQLKTDIRTWESHSIVSNLKPICK